MLPSVVMLVPAPHDDLLRSLLEVRACWAGRLGLTVSPRSWELKGPQKLFLPPGKDPVSAPAAHLPAARKEGEPGSHTQGATTMNWDLAKGLP